MVKLSGQSSGLISTRDIVSIYASLFAWSHIWVLLVSIYVAITLLQKAKSIVSAFSFSLFYRKQI